MTGFPVRPVTVAIDIPAEPDAVFSVVSDTRRDPEWCPNVTNVEQRAGDGVAIGALFHFDQTIEARGRTLHSGVDVEVVELGERHVAWRVEDRFQTRTIHLTVAPRQGGCVVTQTTEASFKKKPGAAKWFYPLLARRTFRDQFEQLRTLFPDG
jgi:hypothetical protein